MSAMKRQIGKGILVTLACAIASPLPAAVCPTALLDGSRVLQYYQAGSAAEYVADSGLDLGFGDARRDIVGFYFYSFSNHLATETGSFDLASVSNSNLQTCEQCIVVREDFDGMHTPKMLFQTGGTLTVDPTTPPGSDPILLTWQNVTLAEITVDGTGSSTFVPNGECRTVVVDEIFAGGFETGH